MRRSNWLRVVLCGSIAGTIWYLLSAVFLSLFGQELLAVVQKGGSYPRWSGPILALGAALAATLAFSSG